MTEFPICFNPWQQSGSRKNVSRAASSRGGVVTNPTLFPDYVSENKAVSFDDLTHLNRKRSVKNRGGVDEGLKLSVLSARVYPFR